MARRADGLARALSAMLLVAASSVPAASSDATDGRALAHGTTKGNCLACHTMPTDPAAVTSADIGPPLAGMRARFPDRARLRAQVWDASAANPRTIMPPFGRNGILTDAEIDRIVDYLYTL